MITNNELQLITSAAQAIFAFGLLIATIIYTHYTRRQSDATNKQIAAMESQTKATYKPYLKATIEHPNFAEYFFAIRNTGNGAAHDVTATWEIGDDGEERSWNIPLIPPGKKHRFIIVSHDDAPVSDGKRIKEVLSQRGFKLDFDANCKDISGEKHPFEEEINLQKAIWGRREDSYEWVEEPVKEKISKNIDSISDDIGYVGNVAKTLQRDSRSIIYSYQMEQYLNRLERFGELSVEQLSRLFYRKPPLIRIHMNLLAEQDLVDFDEEANMVKLRDTDG